MNQVKKNVFDVLISIILVPYFEYIGLGTHVVQTPVNFSWLILYKSSDESNLDPCLIEEISNVRAWSPSFGLPNDR